MQCSEKEMEGSSRYTPSREMEEPQKDERVAREAARKGQKEVETDRKTNRQKETERMRKK